MMRVGTLDKGPSKFIISIKISMFRKDIQEVPTYTWFLTCMCTEVLLSI